MGETSRAGDVAARKHKSKCGGTAVSFLSFSNRYSVCVSVDLCCESYLVLFVLTQSLEISSTMSKVQRKLALEGREQIALQAVCSSLLPF